MYILLYILFVLCVYIAWFFLFFGKLWKHGGIQVCQGLLWFWVSNSVEFLSSQCHALPRILISCSSSSRTYSITVWSWLLWARIVAVFFWQKKFLFVDYLHLLFKIYNNANKNFCVWIISDKKYWNTKCCFEGVKFHFHCDSWKETLYFVESGRDRLK